MILSEWLGHIHRSHDKVMDFRLDRLINFAKNVGLLPVPYRVITVGGTNGKGTTVSLLSHLLYQSGMKVGRFTSPHLLRYNERIVVNEKMITDDALCDAFSVVERWRNRDNVALTEFEFGLFAALVVFKEQNLDVVVLEVGLGGRLDAVNIVDADISVITSIGIDHEAILGHSRDAIAKEKAGIFRAKKPVVCGDLSPPGTLIGAAKSLQCPLFQVNKDYFFSRDETSWQWCADNKRLTALPLPNIPLVNAATALMVVEVLSQILPIDLASVQHSLKDFSVPGRLQCVHEQPTIILDVAHNPAAAEYLATYLAHNACVTGKTRAVFSALEDKAVDGVVRVMRPVIDAWHIAPLDVLRRAKKAQLEAACLGCDVKSESSIRAAFLSALGAAKKNDRIVVFGSFHVLEALWPCLQDIPALCLA